MTGFTTPTEVGFNSVLIEVLVSSALKKVGVYIDGA